MQTVFRSHSHFAIRAEIFKGKVIIVLCFFLSMKINVFLRSLFIYVNGSQPNNQWLKLIIQKTTVLKRFSFNKKNLKNSWVEQFLGNFKQDNVLHFMGTIFSGGLIHIWYASLYKRQQGGVKRDQLKLHCDEVTSCSSVVLLTDVFLPVLEQQLYKSGCTSDLTYIGNNAKGKERWSAKKWKCSQGRVTTHTVQYVSALLALMHSCVINRNKSRSAARYSTCILVGPSACPTICKCSHSALLGYGLKTI